MIRKFVSLTLAAALFAIAAIGAGCGGGKDADQSVQTAAEERPGSSREGGFPRNDLSVLLISIDTCRPDRIGCYGYDKIETPRIDEIAREGIRFDRAVVPAPITLPSHASILTSEYPYRHRVRNNGTYSLPEENTTLAEWLKGEGYRTAAFLGAYPLDGRFGLNQGFDTYDDRFPPKKVGSSHDISERPADAVVDEAVRWLEEEGKKDPFFLFVHFFDPHWPYDPPEPFREMYSSSPYDGEIAFVDGEVGRLLDALDRLGLTGRTLVVLVGDHGEGLGEHGEETHAVFAYDATLRVPFLLSWPDREPFRAAGFERGSAVGSMVRAIDIGPTILDLAGLPPLPGVEGRTLLPLLIEPDRSLDLVNYAECFSPREDYGWSEIRTITTERWKFILLPREELYDIVADPDELVNRIDDEPETADSLRALLQERIDEDERRQGESASIEIDAESRERLAALGYISDMGFAPEEASYLDLPDPKDRIGLLRDFFKGRAALDRGEGEAALAIFLELEKQDAENPKVIGAVGDAYLLAGDLTAADSVYRKVTAMLPNDLAFRSNQAQALLKMKRVDEAIEIIRLVLVADPKFENGHARLGDAWLIKGEPERAMEEYQLELEHYPDSPSAFSGLGKVHKLQGRLNEAGKFYRKAIESREDFAEGYFDLGNLYNETGGIEKAISYFRRAIEIDPNLVEAHYNLALIAKKAGQRKSAAQLLEEAVRRKPRFAKAYYGIANLLREEGRHTEAVGFYRRAIECDPQNADFYLNLGVARASLGDLNGAIEAWEKTVRVEPYSESAKTASENIRSARMQMGGK